MTVHTDLLIVGAGPFGLGMAAYAKAHAIDHLLLGEPMDFWRSNMPEGMILRSASDWHLDPAGLHTIEAYLRTQGLTPADVEPLSLPFYLGYTTWFMERKRIEAVRRFVHRLDRDPRGRLVATLDDGEEVIARDVVLALGFRHFRNVPAEVARLVPPDRIAHTCDFVDMERMRGRRCLIVGGRQSAYEWAALLAEHGATEVHVSHRHDAPSFEPSDWSWVGPLVERMVAEPGWFRRLTDEQRTEMGRRFWAEGRLKLEPWLAPRLDAEVVRVWPCSRLVACEPSSDGLGIELDAGRHLTVDQVVMATGYRPDMAAVPLLARGNITVETKDGFPRLDDCLQSSVPGLFITSMPAAQDFGPFFAFTVSVVASAKMIGSAIAAPIRRTA